MHNQYHLPYLGLDLHVLLTAQSYTEIWIALWEGGGKAVINSLPTVTLLDLKGNSVN